MPTSIVTGGAGFIGSHVVDRLLADGHRGDRRRRSLDRRSPDESTTRRTSSRSTSSTSRPSTGSPQPPGPDAIFHLGAQSMVTVSVTDPWRDCDVNVKGTLNVASGRAASTRAPVVFTSTGGALYGNEAPMPTRRARFPPRWLHTGRRNGPARPTCAPGRRPTASRTRSAASETSTARGRARTARPGSSPSSATSSGRVSRARCSATATPTRDYVHVARRRRRDGARLGRRRRLQHLGRPRGPGAGDLRAARAGRPGVESEPELAPLREGELERSCMDPTAAAESARLARSRFR